ncbi:MAG: HAD hydrolase-like protein [Bacteroidota bacterium]
MNIKLAVFDLAGTTVHDEDFVALALKEALATENISIEISDANRFMGIPKPLAIKHLIFEKTGKDYPVYDNFIDAIFNRFLDIMLDFYKNSESVREIEGVSETFAYLKEKRIRIAVDTGFSKVITDVIIEKMQWIEKGLLDFSVSSDEVDRGRPNPDMIYHLMKKSFITKPSEVAKIGDTPADLNEGYNAGCAYNIGVLSGSCTSAELSEHPHTHILNSVVDIKNLQIL